MPLLTILNHLGPLETIWYHFRTFGTIWVHLDYKSLFWTNWDQLGISKNISIHLRLFLSHFGLYWATVQYALCSVCTISDHFLIVRSIWTIFDNFGHFPIYIWNFLFFSTFTLLLCSNISITKPLLTPPPNAVKNAINTYLIQYY